MPSTRGAAPAGPSSRTTWTGTTASCSRRAGCPPCCITTCAGTCTAPARSSCRRTAPWTARSSPRPRPSRSSRRSTSRPRRRPSRRPGSQYSRGCRDSCRSNAHGCGSFMAFARLGPARWQADGGPGEWGHRRPHRLDAGRGARDNRRVPEDEIDYDARAADRLTLFSDAVVAIAITLLAIDLPVPHGPTVPDSGRRSGTIAALRGFPDQLLRDRRGVAGPPWHFPLRQAGGLAATDDQYFLAADDRP